MLAALGVGCGPDGIDPVADAGTTTSASIDEGIVVETGTDTGSSGDPEICFVEINAFGTGDCDEPFGYRWTTGGCTLERGCSCQGTDCDLLYETRSECVEAHLHCDLCDPCPESMACVVHCDGTGFTSDISCGGGCWDGEADYYCPMTDLDQPADADVECSGLGRVVLRQRAVSQLVRVDPVAHASRREPAARCAAHAWAKIHACERASVDGFERLAAQLEALGAPIELITNAERFAADERRHAAATLAIARRFDPEVEPPELEAAQSSATPDLHTLLEDTILAGCIGETLSALELEHMRAACHDEALAFVLAEIADDEARHAEHAWALLAYLLRRFPALRDPAVQLFGRRCATFPLNLDHDLPELGLLADGTRAELWEAGRRRVVDRLAAHVLSLEAGAVEQTPSSPDPILC